MNISGIGIIQQYSYTAFFVLILPNIVRAKRNDVTSKAEVQPVLFK